VTFLEIEEGDSNLLVGVVFFVLSLPALGDDGTERSDEDCGVMGNPCLLGKEGVLSYLSFGHLVEEATSGRSSDTLA